MSTKSESNPGSKPASRPASNTGSKSASKPGSKTASEGCLEVIDDCMGGISKVCKGELPELNPVGVVSKEPLGATSVLDGSIMQKSFDLFKPSGESNDKKSANENTCDCDGKGKTCSDKNCKKKVETPDKENCLLCKPSKPASKTASKE